MKKALMIFLVFAALKATGQNHLIGLKASSNVTNISSTNFPTEHKPKSAGVAGLTYDYLFNEHLSVGAGILYDQRGFTSEYIFLDKTGVEYGKYNINYEYDYLALPIKAGFTSGSKFYGFADLGIIPSLLLDASYIFPLFNSEGELIGDEIIDANNDVNVFDFAGMAEIGAGYKIRNKYWFYASFAYQKSFTNTYKSKFLTSDDIKHYGTSVSIGLKYLLVKDQ